MGIFRKTTNEPRPDDCAFCDRIDAHDYCGTPVGGIVRFEPLNPVTEGHMLFVPVAHATHAPMNPYLAGLTLEAAAHWAWLEDVGPANFITSAGAPATQTVFHIHVHVVPRTEGDGLALPWTGQTPRTSN